MPSLIETIIDDINNATVEVDDVVVTNAEEEEIDSDNESLSSEDDSVGSEIDFIESDDEDARAHTQNKVKWKDAVDPFRNLRATLDEARFQTFELCKQEKEFIVNRIKGKLNGRGEKDLLTIVDLIFGKDSDLWKELDDKLNRNSTDEDRMDHELFLKNIVTYFTLGGYNQVRMSSLHINSFSISPMHRNNHSHIPTTHSICNTLYSPQLQCIAPTILWTHRSMPQRMSTSSSGIGWLGMRTKMRKAFLCGRGYKMP